MPTSNNYLPGEVLSFSLKVNGSPIPDQYLVQSVYVEKKVNHIPIARIVLQDGDMATGNFEASSSSIFVPGNEISIEAGYDSNNKLIFKGIITQQSIRINDASGSTLEVDCRDAAVRMTIGRKSLSFAQQKDSDIIASIIGQYAGLNANVSPTETVWPIQVQQYVSDWDYILSLADNNGLIVTTINGVVHVARPGTNDSPVIKLTYGDNIYAFNASLNAINQFKKVKATAWDHKNQSLNTAQHSDNIAGPGNISSNKLAEVIGLSEYNLQTNAPLDHSALTIWAKAQVVKSEFAKIVGSVKFAGSPGLEPGGIITLAGVGDRFNGNHFVSGVIHNLSDGNWFTEANFGLSTDWVTENQAVMSPPASGLIPPARGLFNGIVSQIENDPENQYRVLVNVPLFDVQGQGIWARLSNFYATSGAGAFFLPEVGDEVVLGFLNEDPRYPVILGSMYSANKAPRKGLVPEDTNPKKALISRSGIEIEFDDMDNILSISTPAKNTIIFSDKDKKISIKDQNGNSILMSLNGIDINSPKNIHITSDQKICIKGMQGMELNSAVGDIDISGLNIKETAAVQYSANGSVTTTVTSGGKLTINGAMVMIN